MDSFEKLKQLRDSLPSGYDLKPKKEAREEQICKTEEDRVVAEWLSQYGNSELTNKNGIKKTGSVVRHSSVRGKYGELKDSAGTTKKTINKVKGDDEELLRLMGG